MNKHWNDRTEAEKRAYWRGWNAYIDGKQKAEIPSDELEGFKHAATEHRLDGVLPNRFVGLCNRD